jgi:hypothetical protein
MKVKGGTYFWLFTAVVLVLVGAWKCISVMAAPELAGSAGGDQIGGWTTMLVIAIAFFAWRCYRFVEEKRTIEFLAKERKRAEEIERRIKLENENRDRKWFEEQRAHTVKGVGM